MKNFFWSNEANEMFFVFFFRLLWFARRNPILTTISRWVLLRKHATLHNIGFPNTHLYGSSSNRRNPQIDLSLKWYFVHRTCENLLSVTIRVKRYDKHFGCQLKTFKMIWLWIILHHSCDLTSFQSAETVNLSGARALSWCSHLQCKCLAQRSNGGCGRLELSWCDQYF